MLLEPVDFTSVSSVNLEFLPRSDTKQYFEVIIVDDGIAEDNETFSVALDTSDGAVVLDPVSTTIITIVDNDCKHYTNKNYCVVFFPQWLQLVGNN